MSVLDKMYNAISETTYSIYKNMIEYHTYDEMARIYKNRADSAYEKKVLFNASNAGENSIGHALSEIYMAVNMLNVTDIWTGASADACKETIMDIVARVEECGSEAVTFFDELYQKNLDLASTNTDKAKNARNRFTIVEQIFEASGNSAGLKKQIKEKVRNSI